MLGTRPEAIKLAPVAAALDAGGLPVSLVWTGQHPGLDPADFQLAGLPASVLGLPGRGDPHGHVRDVARAAAPLLAGAALVVVQGDTSSALGGALAAGLAGVPLAHVEAGLRSHDPANPWPEEEYRLAIDGLAALLFAPTELSAANLRRERVGGQIHVTGNTGIDALARRAPLGPARRPGAAPRLLVTCHRRENWGAGLAEIAAALRGIAGRGLASVRLVLHPNPRVARQMRALLGGSDVALIAPLSHPGMIAALCEADLVLSDSGGLQEEAAGLGIPLLVLRETTERPEAIATGNLAIVGASAERIVARVEMLLGSPEALARMRRPSSPFGDGQAAMRIARIVARWLDETGLAVRPAHCPALRTAAAS